VTACAGWNFVQPGTPLAPFPHPRADAPAPKSRSATGPNSSGTDAAGYSRRHTPNLEWLRAPLRKQRKGLIERSQSKAHRADRAGPSKPVPGFRPAGQAKG